MRKKIYTQWNFVEKAKYYSRREYARRTNPRLGKKCKKMPHIYVTSTHQKKQPKPKIVSNNEAVIYMRNNRHTIASKTITQNTQTLAQLTTSAAEVGTSNIHSTAHDHRACMDITEPQNLHNNTAVSAQHPTVDPHATNPTSFPPY